MWQSEVAPPLTSTTCCCLPVKRRQTQQSPCHSVPRISSKKMLTCNNRPNKVLLYPEEGWARSAASSYWTVAPFWWCRSRCKVVEVAGTRRYSTKAKLVDSGTGNVFVVGSFKKMSIDPDFKLCLTSNVSMSDFNMGYIMTGALERGCKKSNTFQMTHFAVIRRLDYDTS